MTHISPVSSAASLPAHRPPSPPANDRQKRARAVATTLATVHDKYLSVFQRWADLGASVPSPKTEGSGIGRYFLWKQRPQFSQPNTEEDRAEMLMVLKMRLQEGPHPDTVAEAVSATYDVYELVNQNQIRTIVAMMLDAFPNARPHSPETWMETLAHELKVSGFSVLVVAKACNMLTRSEKFAPSVAEVVECCETVKRFVENVLDAADTAAYQRAVYTKAIAWLRTVPVWDSVNRPARERLEVDLPFDPFATDRARPQRPSTGRQSWV